MRLKGISHVQLSWKRHPSLCRASPQGMFLKEFFLYIQLQSIEEREEDS